MSLILSAMLSMADFLKGAGDALPRSTIDNLLLIAMIISRHPLTAGRFGKYPVNVCFRPTPVRTEPTDWSAEPPLGLNCRQGLPRSRLRRLVRMLIVMLPWLALPPVMATGSKPTNS